VAIWQWEETTTADVGAAAERLQSAVERGVGFFTEEVRYQTSRVSMRKGR
jgi:hypothetical protein